MCALLEILKYVEMTICLHITGQHVLGSALDGVEGKRNVVVAQQPIDGHPNAGSGTMGLLAFQVLGTGDGQIGRIALRIRKV